MGCDFGKNKISENIQDNIFACPECGIINPEISKINVDNKKIEFYCKKCAEKEYKAEFFEREDKGETINYYLEPKGNENVDHKFWFKEYKMNNEVESSIVKSLLKKIFRNELEKNKNIINKKNEQLQRIIEFNKIVKNTCQKYQNNYLHLKSLKNIYLSLQKEIIRDSNDLKFLLSAFNNEIKFSEKAIEVLEKKTEIKIKREEESLFLRKKKINDTNIMSLSLIKFNQLKELDLSENEITNIEPISKMSLPFLEFLNLSYNNIKDIKSLGEINSRKLKYLFIQNNQIENIQFVKDWDFPKLRILRLENNNNIQEITDPEILNIANKKKLIIVTNNKINEIKRLYNIEYDENKDKIELEQKDEVKGEEKKEVLDKTEEDEEDELILMNLFIIISQKNENKISKLSLQKYKIKNPSILNRIQFNSLEELNLSINNIKDLHYLKGMKAENLKRLYLDNNNINDLSLLYKIKDLFPDLEEISLKNNNFNLDEAQRKELVKYLNSKDIKLQI